MPLTTGWMKCTTPEENAEALAPRFNAKPQAFEIRHGCEPTCPVCRMPNALLSDFARVPQGHVDFRACRDCGCVFLPDGRQCRGIVTRVQDHPEKGEDSGWSRVLCRPER